MVTVNTSNETVNISWPRCLVCQLKDYLFVWSMDSLIDHGLEEDQEKMVELEGKYTVSQKNKTLDFLS